MSIIKRKKLLIITVLLIIFNVCFNTSVYATTMDDVISQGESFLAARNSDAVIDEQALADTSNTIYNILFTIAIVLSIAIGMIIGVQFITGSVDEQAKIKETLVPYVIGVFVVFASFTIWKIAIELGNDFSPTPAAQSPAGQRPNHISECPYCGTTLHSGQVEDLSRYGTTTCRNGRCGQTITN